MTDDSLSLQLEKCFQNFDASISDVQKAYRRVWRKIDTFKTQESLPKDYLSEMAGNLAHEIRNPLCGIANLVTLLADGDNSQKSTGVRGILEGVQRIDKIVENLIVFSQPVVVNQISCNLSDILRSAVAIIRREHHDFAEQDYELVLDVPEAPVFSRVDPELILKVVKNIVQNALENMPNGGKVVLKLTSKKGSLNLDICDEGHGLESEDSEKPFYPFYTTKTYGMGLGLSISRLILEKHGCEIWLRSNQTKGVTVTMQFPQENEAAGAKK